MTCHVYPVAQGSLAFSSFFCCYQYHTIGCPCTVNGCGCRVFQHGNVFDIIRRKVYHIANNAIDQYERTVIGAAAEGSSSTDQESRVISSRLGRGLRYLQTCDTPLQQVCCVWCRPFGQHLPGNRGYGTGQVALFLGTITYHHYIRHHFIRCCHLNGKGVSASDIYLLVLHSYIGKNKGSG
jgi:hypothetical protein